METRKQRYHQAAITYFIYGVIYLTGAVYLAEINVVDRSGWVWFLVGMAFVVVLPPLIWYEYKWVTRILAVLVGVRVFGLGHTILTGGGESVPMPWGGEIVLRTGAVGFLLVAAVAGVMLVRAGWTVGGKEESS